MSYSTNITLDNVKNDMFIVMKPRRRITSWTLYGGSVYRAQCPFNVVVVEQNGTTYTEQSSTSLSASQWYYNSEEQYLYIRMSDSGAPDSSDWIVATIELFVATKETLWYRIPTDSTSRLVQYYGCVKNTPSIRKSRNQQQLGFYPIESTGLTCANDPDLFQDIIWDASFNDAEINVYHLSGELDADNFNKIITASLGNFSFDDEEINFGIYDSSISLDTEFNPVNSAKFYGNGGGIDPQFAGKPIRMFWGRVSGVMAVNRTFGTTNREWSVMAGLKSQFTHLDIPVTNVTTGTNINVSVANASFMTGGSSSVADYVWVYDVNDGSGAYHIRISSLDYSTGAIVLSPSVSVSHLQVGSLLRRSPYRVTLCQGAATYRLAYGRDFALTDWPDGSTGFTLDMSAESNVGASTFDPTTDYILVTVDGRGDLPTMNGSGFGAYKQGRPTYWNGVIVLYDILKNVFGMSESEIDTASFTSAYSAINTELSFGYPFAEDMSFGTYKDLISEILSNILLCAQFDSDGKFSIQPLAGITTADYSVTQDDIKAGSWKYDMSYDDVGGVLFITRNREYSYNTSDATLYPPGAFDSEDVVQSNATQYLHKSRKYTTVRGLVNIPDDKVLSLFSERYGRATIELNSQFFEREINDSVEIQREKMPGFAYEKGTLRSRNFRIVEIQKDLGRVVISLDDQKGMDDSGEW